MLWRPGPDGPELGIIHRPRYDDWSFPKGKMDAGEHIQHTAQREVLEETGYRAILGRRLPTISYQVNGVPKRVRYWAARAVTEHSEAGSSPFIPNAEVDGLAWLTPAEARLRLSRALDTTVLDAFMSAPVDTIPIILLRHGTAEHRSEHRWPDDRLRPLTPQGKAQAERLAPLLTGYGPLDIVSSPAIRCLDTVRPYAGSRHVVIDVDPALSESAHEAAPHAAASWIRALIAKGRPTLVSTHRPVLNALIAAAFPPPDAPDRTGGPHAPDDLYAPDAPEGSDAPDAADGSDAPEGPNALDAPNGPDSTDGPFAPDGPRINGRPWTRREAERVHNGKLATGSAWVLHVTPRQGPHRLPRLVAADRLRP